MPLLEPPGTEIPESRMPSLPVVEPLDVVEELSARCRPRRPRRVVDELDLQRGKEALRDRVVPAIAPAAHAADDPMPGQGLAVVAAGVLTATIRMMQQPLGWTPTGQRHPERVEREFVGDAGT